MNEPQREIFAKNLEDASQEELQDMQPQDSIDNFTCPASPASAKVTWTTRRDSSRRLVNIVCWDTSGYNVNTTLIDLSRIEWVNGVKNIYPLLTNVSGYNPPYVDRSGINLSHWYQYSLEISFAHRPVTRVSVIAQPMIATEVPPILPIPPIFNTEEELVAELERSAVLGERATPNAGEHINELPPAQLKNSHLENPEG